MNTSFDELYEHFIRNTRVSSLDLPSTIEGQKQLIYDAVMEFNIRLRIGGNELTYDDVLELFGEELSTGDFVFLSECITLATYKKMKDEYISTWETFQNDVGRKNYKDQLQGRQNNILEQEARLNRLKLAICEDFVEG